MKTSEQILDAVEKEIEDLKKGAAPINVLQVLVLNLMELEKRVEAMDKNMAVMAEAIELLQKGLAAEKSLIERIVLRVFPPKRTQQVH